MASRRSRRRPGVAMLAMFAAIVGGLVTAAPSDGATRATSTSPSASALQAKAIANAENSQWVHEVTRAKAPGHTFAAVDDIGFFEGRQVIHSDDSHAEVVQVGQQAYIRGDASAIQHYFGLTKDDPQQLADTWISIGPSDGGEYSTVIAAVTLKSDFGHETIPGRLTVGRPVTVDGKRCIPIIGHTSQSGLGTVTVTMYVTATNHPLPLEVRATAKHDSIDVTKWSRWGQPVTLTPPPDAVPYSSLGG